MSNAEASRVYEIIVESVVNEVREDFENAGIDEQTLQDLKNIWQKKLTETKVTTFSWDNQFNEGNINGVQNDLNFNLATPGVNSSEFNIKEENTGSALLDTDEVGSELDDSDDDYLISEGEEDGPDENLMLCLYDKVTRTKARWKCSLKDGVVTINRNDYTFQKAQVEAEWV
uniref:Transcription initiation factor IIA large subunit n=1 Tax=Saccharomyces cerevisiae TaxID=4932 RepID=UPI000F62C1DE|nr:Chain U, Transcription initiation factor IIA large subunit,Transcription initiation factor IIA large subunit [Saccharomyces cerevisiae S288C]6GYL_U Chain U, Transcription initiation factor IIA large subunit,Transcription initiation factor IIA large subunit [Saccharomyces cerevisiae S288C]6GYM_U Chain U, Transcription initiation factor IIA large subunit,Transcription initiation factor IIA large subunit [Saccharomyces cerevisiae S288C]7O4I_U Chain U, Transcription initiation factor IIA large su